MGSALDCLLDHALGHHAGTHPASSSPVAHHPDALFVVVGVLAGLARRIVPRVLCVQLLETIALTVCGFPPLSYARPRPRLRVRLDVGHRCPRSFCAVCSTRPTVPFLRRRLYLLGKHSACSTSSRHHASGPTNALRTVHYLPSGMHTASAAPATFISSARLRCPLAFAPQLE
ncbi:hypothetical protein A0H81_11689 [Grifola frondosa]|uniref:Uncharacterized protein n=1 Tax=Grifola frondosa TaxID=5627 RepID=A0A1C7LTC9_GRIFR|nr:hypothetical protein A0H81_11689 [Grifola frondosa]